MPVNSQPRIAFFTPLLPVKSGISDYSEELLPDLGRLAQVDAVTDGTYLPSTAALKQHCGIVTESQFRRDPSRYDIAVYQIANSFDHHAYCVPSMEQSPGILVLHDLCLQYLVLGLTLRSGRFDALVDTLSHTYGSEAHSLARKIQLGLVDPNLYTFARPFIVRSRAVIVHSQAAAEAVQRECPGKLVRVVHMGVPLPEETGDGIRARFALTPDDFVVASISTLSYTKRLIKVLEVFRTLHAARPNARLLIVGGGSVGDGARRFIAEHKLQNAIVCTGWVSNEDYAGLIGTADVVVDIRYPSGTETSASLMRAIAAGRPVVVSDQGTFKELPDTFCRKIAVDSNEEGALVRELERLYDSPAERHAMSAAARSWSAGNLRLSTAARRYVDFAQEVIARPDTQISPGPMFGHHKKARTGDALLYKAARVSYLYRNYGLRDTLRRVSEEAFRKS